MNLDYKQRKTMKRICIGILVGVCFVFSVLAVYFPNIAPFTKDELIGVSSNENFQKYPMLVYFMDVGQADCSIIHTQNVSIMIDAGDVDDFPKIQSVLDALDIERLDYLILTHAHADHIGSADDVIENYSVSNVIMPKYTGENVPTSRVYEDLLDALSKSNAKIYAPNPLDEYTLQDLSFEILGPSEEYDNINNSSVVTRVTYFNHAFLFQGDAEKASEKEILKLGTNIHADVIKLGHHGSKTSSTNEYLYAVSPKFAVISCGLNNKYKMPHPEVLNRLEKQGIDYKRTDLDGDIILYSDGQKLYVETENAA